MRGRIILIEHPEERPSQAALLVDGRLEDLLLDPPTGNRAPAPGDIYWAKVERVVPKMGGAFVSLTPTNMGFLRDAKGFSEGQGVTVQVSAYAESGKATPVTVRVLYKGRLAIHTPSSPGINISRQIKDTDERERLKTCAEETVAEQTGGTGDREGPVWENPGIILRSAAQGATAEALRESIREVLAARGRAERQTAETPPLVHAIAIGSSSEAIACREWQGTLEEGPDLFGHYGVWDEIERLKSARVDLPSGAWMAVEATRAMVTVDVNTGGEFGGGSALTANLETARELPRQLRLRGLGGQVIVDFAPLPKKDRRRIEETLKSAFGKDPVDTALAGWTPLGNFELQRKRERRPLAELLA